MQKNKTNVKFGCNRIDRTFILGDFLQLQENTLKRISIKQNCAVLLSSEAEYFSATNVAHGIIWLTNLMKDLGIPQKTPTTLFIDVQSCIKFTDLENHISRPQNT